MASEFRIIKYLEWCVELPSRDCARESPVFIVKGGECSFRFALEKQQAWYYNLYMEFRCEHTVFKSCIGNVEVGFKSELTLSWRNNFFRMAEPGSKKIWNNGMKDLQSKLPSDYMDYVNGNWIKFLFSFDDMAILLNSEELGDKGLQTGSYLNTNVSVESVAEDFSKLLDLGPNHDVEIKCGEHSIKAHKIILTARSEVLKAMLESNMLEGQTGIVVIQDMDINYVRDFVRYLYTGAMPELCFDKAKILYEAGDRYAVRSLMLRCSDFLQDNLSPENVFECFALADAHSDQKLQDKIKVYLLEEKIYLQRKHWLPFCESFPKAANEVYLLSYENSREE